MFLIENEEAVRKALSALEDAGINYPRHYRVDRTSITFFDDPGQAVGKLQYRWRGDKLVFITEKEIPHKPMR